MITTSLLTSLASTLAAADPAAMTEFPIAQPVDGMSWAGWILWLPLLSLLGCGICAAMKIRNKLPAWITSVCLGASFVITLLVYLGFEQPMIIELFRWFDIETAADRNFVANFSLYIDKLTLLWMLFVTGLGTLIAIYASEYMETDVGHGYSRFFAGVSVFLFAMSALVMGDNLVMLYLGWEGVGFASYWLIGYYYQRPSAVAAAKKAFIVNRIGDLGLALGIWLTWNTFGTVEYARLFELLQSGGFDLEAGGWTVQALPYLFMIGAFGKSAQLPLYVWLPDAMEGPTPVSALIHAATMVTAGVYLIARMFPLFLLDPTSLQVVAWIGGLTALLAATIGMAQYDIKRIFAYSTVSQLGYMFLGLGVITTFGAAYHVFTHAFFKAVLFLTCGAVMHGFAGQLDLRKVSGLRKMTGWKITAWTMFIGCLCLAGFPGTSGFFSKDAILAEVFVQERYVLGWLALFTAGLTAYYTFRVWFRVCAGPVHYEMGDEHHVPGEAENADVPAQAAREPKTAAHHDDHHHEPHAPRLAINAVLVIIAIGALLAAVPYFMPNQVEGVHGGWVGDMMADTSAEPGLPGGGHAVHGVNAEDAAGHTEAAHGSIFGFDPHTAMYFVSATFGIIGLLIAWYLHLQNRKAADQLRARLLANPATRWLPTAMENKWYVDEFYDWTIRKPLWWLGGKFLAFVDNWILDRGIVDGIARIPKWIGRAFQPLQSGVLHAYALTMAGGVVLVTLLVLVMPIVFDMVRTWMGGGG